MCWNGFKLLFINDQLLFYFVIVDKIVYKSFLMNKDHFNRSFNLSLLNIYKLISENMSL